MTRSKKTRPAGQYKPGEVFYCVNRGQLEIHVILEVDRTQEPYPYVVRTIYVCPGDSTEETSVSLEWETCRLDVGDVRHFAQGSMTEKKFDFHCLAGAVGMPLRKIWIAYYRKLKGKVSRRLKRYERILARANDPNTSQYQVREAARKIKELKRRRSQYELEITKRGGRVVKRA